MNRSNFFKTLGIGLLSAPTIVKVLAEPPKPKQRMWVPNPEWFDAPYEVEFWCYPGTFDRLVPAKYTGCTFAPDNKPLRCDASGCLVEQWIDAETLLK